MKTANSALLAATMALAACATAKDSTGNVATELNFRSRKGLASPQPKAVVYRTAGDYSDNVPVTMSADGKRIVAYPAPTDLSYAGNMATPIRLKNGYLLDRRGVGRNTAFLTYTYSEYAALETVPPATELMKKIKHPKPIIEMHLLPITVDEAIADTALCNRIIESDFDGCETAIGVKKLKIKPLEK